MSLWEIYKAKRLGYADDLWTSLIGHQLGGYSWISTDYEQTPYIYRAMPNMSHYYNREIMEEVVGGSVGWNQLCNGSSVTVQSGHKYFLKKGNAESVGASAGSAITGLTSGSDMVVDLTLALGSTIADYIYSLEQATAGSGVAWLKEHFPRMFGQYNAYDAGSIQSVSGLVSHDTVGKNLWNPNGELSLLNCYVESGTAQQRVGQEIRLPAGTYTMKLTLVGEGGFIYLNKVNESGAFLSFEYLSTGGNGFTRTVTLSDGDYLLVFDQQTTSVGATTHFGDYEIQLELGSTATSYEPYRKSSYPLDSTLTLRGIPELDNGKLYYDGDVYESDGTVTRKYGVVDLGTLNWVYFDTGAYFSAVLSDSPVDALSICSKYNRVTTWASVTDGNYRIGTNAIRIADADYTDAVAFKTAVSGVYLVYELATPTTETAQPFTKTQLCDSGGTEEFVTSGIVSVGHKSKYAEK